MEHFNKQDIQYQIDHRGDHQIIQWMAAVPNRLQNTYKDVVHDKAQRTGKIDL